MKNLIYNWIAIVAGVALAASSEFINGSQSFGLGFWATYIGVCIITIASTRQHAIGEAARRIKRSRKARRVVYRTIYFTVISLGVFREASLEALYLGISQALLFGILFDPIRNKFAGDHFFYHGAESGLDNLVKKHPVTFFIVEIILFVIFTIIVLISD